MLESSRTLLSRTRRPRVTSEKTVPTVTDENRWQWTEELLGADEPRVQGWGE